MPQSVMVWIGEWALSAGIYIEGTSAILLSGAIYVGTAVAITAGLAELSKMLGPDPKQMPTNVGEYNDTVADRRIIYGQTKVGGMNVIPPVSTGSEGKYLHQVLAIAGHEISEVYSVFVDQDELNYSSYFDPIASDLTSGQCNTGTYEDILWCRVYTGTSTQTADWILENYLISSDSPQRDLWNSNHRGRGVAYAALMYLYESNNAFSRGKPEINFLVRGKKTYDPRLDPSPGTNYDNPAYITFNSNPALALVDYLIDNSIGMGEDPARIDWSSVAAAANICDEPVLCPTGGSPAGSPAWTTQSRYTCNIVLDATDRFEDNIEALCSCMLGHCHYSMGRWFIYAGAWPISDSFALAEDDLAGGVSIQTDTPRNQKYNSVRGQFYDEIRNYEPVEFQPRTNATYVANDGETIWREVALRGCTNEYEAQRIAIIGVRRSRNTKIVTADFKLSAFKVKLYEVGTLTLEEAGWTDKPVRCIGWEFRPEGTVRLTLRAENEADWDDPSYGDYTLTNAYVTPTSGRYVPPVPVSLNTFTRPDGVLLTWSTGGVIGSLFGLPPGCYFELARSETSSFPSPYSYAKTYNRHYLDTGVGGNTYYYWVRSVTAVGYPSEWYPSSASSGVAGTGEAIGSPGQDGFNSFTITAYKRSAATPTDNPGGFLYTFATNGWTGGSPSDHNGWTQWVPDPGSPTYPVWGCYAHAYAQTATDTIESGDWSAPVKLFDDGADGAPGEPGSPGAPGEPGSPGKPGSPGASAVTWRILAFQGTTLKNGDGTLTLYATKIDYAPPVTMEYPTSASTSPGENIMLYVGNTPVTVGNGYAAGSDGYTGVFDSGDIVDTSVSPIQYRTTVTLKDVTTSPHTVYDALVLTQVYDGDAGLSVREVTIYRRWATQPNTPAGGSYNFTIHELTPPGSPVGWSATIPDQSSPKAPVWVSQGVAAITGQVGTDSDITWSTPVKGFEDGIDGLPGSPGMDGQAVDMVFARSDVQPTTPSSSVTTPPAPSGSPEVTWYSDVDSVPAASPWVPMWSSVGTRVDTGSNWIWQTPIKIEGEDGAAGSPGTPGDDGLSIVELLIYRRRWAAGSPSGGSYNFTTTTLTPPTNWSASIPTPGSPTYPVWVSVGQASVVGQTGIDSSISWSAPVRAFQDGIDGARGSPGSIYYIKALNGAAMHNGSPSTLTLEAHLLTGGLDEHLQSGDVMLYVGNTPVTDGNGYVTGSDGYTGIFDAGDINNDVIVLLKNVTTSPHTIHDTYTLVDISDGVDGSPGQDGAPGADAVYGYIEPNRPVVWVRASDQTTWVPSTTTVDLDTYFVQGGYEVGRRAYRITRDSAGKLTGAYTTHKDGDYPSPLNITAAATYGSPSRVVSVTFTYTDPSTSPITVATVTESLTTSLSGTDGSPGQPGEAGENARLYYIKPLSGIAMHNGSPALITVEAHRLLGITDTLLSAASSPGENARLYVGNTLVHTTNGYASGSDGYTGVFDAGDINYDVVVLLKDTTTSPHTVFDSITLLDISDGEAGSPGLPGSPGQDGADGVFGYIDIDGPTAWLRDTDQTTWTPSANTVDFDVTFVQGGNVVARDAYRITRNATTGKLTGSNTTHPLGDYPTGGSPQLVSITTTIGSPAYTAGVLFTYTSKTSPQYVSKVSERAVVALSGKHGSPGLPGSPGTDGQDGVLYYIKPLDGTAIKNSTGTLTLEAHKVTGAGDELMSASTSPGGPIRLYIGNTLQGDGYTATFDDADISGSVVVLLKRTDTSPHSIFDTITLVDVTDGEPGSPGTDGTSGTHAVYGYIDIDGPTAWVLDTDQVTWTPSATTVDFDVTFVQAGAVVARDAYRITRSAAGKLTGSNTSHPSGDYPSSPVGGLVTITPSIGSPAYTATVTFAYVSHNSPQEKATIAEKVTVAKSGAPGSPGQDGAPGSPGQDGSDGASAFTLTSHGTGTVTLWPNAYAKTTSNGVWDTGVYSEESFTGGMFVSWTINQNDDRNMVGLSRDPSGSASYVGTSPPQGIEYAIYNADDTNVYIYETGTSRGSFGAYSAGDRFTITYDGAVVRYYKNNVEFGWTSPYGVPAASNQTFHLDASLYNTRTDGQPQVYGITMGSYTQPGQAVDIIFKYNSVQPGTPAASYNTPSGWYTDVDAAAAAAGSPMGILWSCVGTRATPSSKWTWQTPVQISGVDGISPPTITLDASGTTFRYLANNMAFPASQTLTFRANKQNIGSTAIWASSPTVTLSTGSPQELVRSLTVANFGDLDKTVITVTAGGYSARVTITRAWRTGDTNLLPVNEWIIDESDDGSGYIGSWANYRAVGVTTGSPSVDKAFIVAGGSTAGYPSGASPSHYPSGPGGTSEPLWYAYTTADADDNNADGGFEMSDAYASSYMLPIRSTQAYRFSIWVYLQRMVQADGALYFGPAPYHAPSPATAAEVRSLNGTLQTNPYFISSTVTDLTNTYNMAAKQWYLLVGVVHGHAYGGTTSTDIPGIYDTSGRKLGVLSEFKWKDATMVDIGIRAFRYSATQSGGRTYWARPRLEEMNGNEPTILELIQSAGRTIPTSHINAYGVTKQAYASINSNVELLDHDNGGVDSPSGWSHFDNNLDYITEVGIDLTRPAGETYTSTVVRVEGYMVFQGNRNPTTLTQAYRVIIKVWDEDASAYIDGDPPMVPGSPTVYYVSGTEEVYDLIPYERDQGGGVAGWGRVWTWESVGRLESMGSFTRIYADPQLFNKNLTFEFYVQTNNSDAGYSPVDVAGWVLKGTVFNVQEIRR